MTDVSGIQTGWGTPSAHELRSVTVGELTALGLPAGSMGPKATAAARFAAGQGGFAAIGALADASAILRGRAGTRVVADDGGSALSFDLHQATR